MDATTIELLMFRASEISRRDAQRLNLPRRLVPCKIVATWIYEANPVSSAHCFSHSGFGRLPQIVRGYRYQIACVRDVPLTGVMLVGLRKTGFDGRTGKYFDRFIFAFFNSIVHKQKFHRCSDKL